MNEWTDGIACQVGQMSEEAPALTLRRLLLLPLLFGVLLLILVQEGLAEMEELPDNIRHIVDAFPVLTSPEFIPFTLLAAFGYLFYLGFRTYFRTMHRVHYTGLGH